MNRFEGTFDWVKNVLPSSKSKKEIVAEEKAGATIEDLRGEGYLKSVEMWKDQIAKGVAGQYGEKYVFTDKDLGIQNMRASGIVFITIDKNSPLLRSESFLEAFDGSFTKKEGNVNVVYSKTLE